MTAPIWLPQVFGLDDHLHGEIEQNIHFSLEAEGRAGNTARQMLGTLQLKPKHITDFLKDISPALNALFLAGYRTRSIDLGFAMIGSNRWGSYQGEFWLRFNFDTRLIEINPRPADTSHSGQNAVRIHCEKIEAGGVDRSIDLGEAVHAEIFDELEHWPPETAGYSLGLVENMFERIFGEAGDGGELVRAERPGPLLNYRRDLTFPLSLYLDTVKQETAVADEIVPLFFSYRAVGQQAERNAAKNVLKAFHVTFFDSLLVFVARALSKQAREAVSAQQDGAQLELPGMLFMLDPANWDMVQKPEALTGDEEEVVELLRDLFSRKFDNLAQAELGIYSDLRTPEDPVIESNPDEDIPVVYSQEAFLPHKSADLIGARLESRDPEDFDDNKLLVCPRVEMTPIERLLDIQLGSPGRPEIRHLRKTSKSQIKDVQDDEAATSPYLPTVLGTMLDLPHAVSGSELPRCEEDPIILRHDVGQALKRLAQLGKRAQIRENEGTDAPLADMGLLGGFKLANEIKRTSFLDALYLLFNYGIFELEELSAAATDFVLVEEILEHYETSTGNYELTHSINPDLRVVIQASGHMTGDLRDNFAWEFLPTPQIKPPEELLAEIRKTNPILAEHLSREHGALIVVAAPGVAIGGLDTAPASCPVSVFRVQSQALVPNPGEAILPGQLLRPIPHSVLSDMEPSYDVKIENGKRVETLLPHDLGEILDAFEENPQSLPMLIASPLETDGRSGIRIEKVPIALKPERHTDGNAVITIDMDDRSSNQRFAYDLRFSVERAHKKNGKYRNGDLGPVETSELVDTIRYELVIFKTTGVSVHVTDTEYGMTTSLWEAAAAGINFSADMLGYDAPSGFFADGEERRFVVPCDYSLRYYVFNMPFHKVPEQGTRLELPDLVYENDGLEERTFNPSTQWYANLASDAVENMATMGVDVVMGFIPLVGEASDLLDLMTYMALGQNKWGQPMGRLEAGITFAGLMLPFVSSKMLSAQKAVADVPPGNPWLAGVETP